jgi:MFS family permease
LSVPFLGSFLVLSAITLLALAVQSQVRVPAPTAADRRGGGRPLSEIVRQPVFVVAAMSAAIGYGIMNLLMNATPLAMKFCSHPFKSAVFVLEWHYVGMYLPGFFTGTIIKRVGALAVILAGIALMAGCVATAVSGDEVWRFWVTLVLLGVGWNFMYTGGTTLLMEAHTPAEKARTQGTNDALVFSTMCVSSASSGAMVTSSGWRAMNLQILPFLGLVAAVVIWLALRRRRAAVVTRA